MRNVFADMLRECGAMLTAGQYGAFVVLSASIYFIYRGTKEIVKIIAFIAASLATVYFLSPDFFAETLRFLQTGFQSLSQMALQVTGGR